MANPPPYPASSDAGILQKSMSYMVSKRYYVPFATLLLIADAAFCGIIISKISYTEIDWKAYMQQVEVFLAGERDYSLLKGDTGPIVYPAGHVYVFSLLYKLTSGGEDIRTAQYLFGLVYMVTLAIVFKLYRKSSNFPHILLVFLCANFRLHSLYLLRMFNDCIAMLFLYASVLAFTKRDWLFASVVYSLAISVKMNILLFLPGILLVEFLAAGLLTTLVSVALIVAIQIVFSLPFDPTSYWPAAFQFNRAFLYKWTVNWKFVSEETFLSKGFSNTLLVLHFTMLFIFLYQVTSPHGGILTVLRRGLTRPTKPAGTSAVVLTPDFIMGTIFTSNTIGILFARTLHYQFYTWYAHQIPYLLWKTRSLGAIFKFAVWAVISVVFIVYPPTENASLCLCIANVVLVVSVLIDSRL